MARSVVRATLVPALCLATALVQTAPLGLHLTTCIPFGNYPAPTVPRFVLWILWWNSDRLLHGYRGYWQAPIFYPAPYSFAYSEPLWLTGLVASPFWWMAVSYHTSSNTALLFGPVALVGLFVFAGRRLFHRRAAIALGLAALSAGLLIAPIAIVQRGVLEAVEPYRPEWMIAATSATWTRIRRCRLPTSYAGGLPTER